MVSTLACMPPLNRQVGGIWNWLSKGDHLAAALDTPIGLNRRACARVRRSCPYILVSRAASQLVPPSL
jgi:hypothetical protein